MSIKHYPSITLDLALTRPTVVEPSPNVLHVAAYFGLGIDEEQTIELIPPTTVTLRGGQVVFVTGPSGGGKSSLLRLIAEAVGLRDDASLVDFDAVSIRPDRPLVDQFGDRPLDEVLPLLARAGLGDAFVMLRSPDQLSDGQRYRFRLARAMHAAAEAEHQTQANRLMVIAADEFGATLDRVTAAVVARQVARWTHAQRNVCFIAATTHDDLLEPLAPDTLIEKPLGTGVTVLERDAQAGSA